MPDSRLAKSLIITGLFFVLSLGPHVDFLAHACGAIAGFIGYLIVEHLAELPRIQRWTETLGTYVSGRMQFIFGIFTLLTMFIVYSPLFNPLSLAAMVVPAFAVMGALVITNVLGKFAPEKPTDLAIENTGEQEKLSQNAKLHETLGPAAHKGTAVPTIDSSDQKNALIEKTSVFCELPTGAPKPNPPPVAVSPLL